MSNFQRAKKGSFWSAVERLSSQGVQFLVQILLARLLAPEDFGVVALATTINIIFQTVNEQGFTMALVYKQNRDEVDYSTVFWTNILISIVGYFIIFLLSTPVSIFFSSPMLKNIMPILGLNLFLQALYIVPLTKLTIKVDFRSQAKVSLFSVILSGSLGLFFAFFWKNVYAIVIQSLSYNLLYALTLFLLLRWKPKFIFSLKRFKELFSYGYKLIISRLISVLFDDFYTFGIGKICSPIFLGYYNRANSFRVLMANNLIHIVQRVSSPMLCESQDSIEKMRDVLLKFMAATALIVYPIIVGMMVFADSIITILLTDKWIEVADIMQYMCPIGFFYLISTFNRNLYNSTGRTDIALHTEILKKILFVVIFIVAIQFNFKMILVSQIIIALFEMLIDSSFAGKLVGLNIFKELYALRKILLATLVMLIVLVIYKSFVENVYYELFGGFFIGLCSYVLLCQFMGIISIKGLINGKINFVKLI